MSFLTKFAKDRKGVTALEYGLIAALIAVVIIGAVTLLGQSLANAFNYVANEISAVTP